MTDLPLTKELGPGVQLRVVAPYYSNKFYDIYLDILDRTYRLHTQEDQAHALAHAKAWTGPYEAFRTIKGIVGLSYDEGRKRYVYNGRWEVFE